MSIQDLKEAESQFKMALNHFNWAERDYIDIAIAELNSALDNLNSVRIELKMPKVEL